jgi:hypothetical protein
VSVHRNIEDKLIEAVNFHLARRFRTSPKISGILAPRIGDLLNALALPGFLFSR